MKKLLAALILFSSPAIAAEPMPSLKSTGIDCSKTLNLYTRTICNNAEYTGVFRINKSQFLIAVPHTVEINNAQDSEIQDSNNLSFFLQSRNTSSTVPIEICMDESIEISFTNEGKLKDGHTACTDSLDYMMAYEVHFDAKTKTLRASGKGECEGLGVGYYKLDLKRKVFDLVAYLTEVDCDNEGYDADSPEIAEYEKSIGAKFPRLQ